MVESEVTAIETLKRNWIWASIAGVLCAGLIAAVCATLIFGMGDRICRGVTVEGMEVGGLTRAQCTDKLKDWALKRASGNLVLTALDARVMGLLPDLGIRYEWKIAADRAFAVGREGNFISRVIRVLTPKGDGKQIRMALAIDNRQMTRTIDKIVKRVNRPHDDARLAEVKDHLTVTQDSYGIRVNEKLALDTIIQGLKSGKLIIPLPVEADKPDVTAADASGIDTLLARFTTPFNPGKRDRTHNLKIAATSISGIIIKPGAEFSYNDVVGPRVVERGFREAPIFVRGKMEPGVGGGICQVSSTLYNVVLMSGLDVVERHIHSRTVTYVTAGRDATVAFGLRDFRFKNPFKTSVGILTHLGASHLTIDIFGSSTDRKNITIFTGPVRYLANKSTKTIFDPKLPPGSHEIVDKGSRGAVVTVYRKIAAPDGTVTTEIVSSDHYRPQPVIVDVGPARRPYAAPVPVIEPIPASSVTTGNGPPPTED